jgi:hypothetical protein
MGRSGAYQLSNWIIAKAEAPHWGRVIPDEGVDLFV